MYSTVNWFDSRKNRGKLFRSCVTSSLMNRLVFELELCQYSFIFKVLCFNVWWLRVKVWIPTMNLSVGSGRSQSSICPSLAPSPSQHSYTVYIIPLWGTQHTDYCFTGARDTGQWQWRPDTLWYGHHWHWWHWLRSTLARV